MKLSFKQYLIEILDSKVEPKLVHSTHRSKIYELSINGNNIRFVAAMHSPGWWVFYFKGEDEDGNETFELTNKGSELKIFSAAKWILTDLIRSNNPDKIELEAQKDENSKNPQKRINLYRKIISKFKHPGYRIVEKDSIDTTYFTLEKIR